METPSRVASLAGLLGAAAAGLCVGGPLAIHAGLLEPGPGFYGFLLGALLGLLALVLGAVGLWLTRAGAGRTGRGRALAGFGIGAAILVGVAVGGAPGRGLPRINDITTDPDDPPAFAAARELPGNRGSDMSYPAEFAALQRAGYDDLAPIRLDAAPAAAFERIERAARELGWQITASDAGAGRIEATEVSAIFRFVDDVVVRVRPADGGSVVDVRSRSRVGRGDVGANAARIRALRDAISG